MPYAFVFISISLFSLMKGREGGELWYGWGRGYIYTLKTAYIPTFISYINSKHLIERERESIIIKRNTAIQADKIYTNI